MSGMRRRGQRQDLGSCRHVGDLVHEYVQDELDAPTTHRLDQHLLVCQLCRESVARERRMMAQLRSFAPDPGRHSSLMAGLLELADDASAPAVPQSRPGRQAPGLVAADAPPQYRSVRRPFTAVLLATGCAGAVFAFVVTPRAASIARVDVQSSVTGSDASAGTGSTGTANATDGAAQVVRTGENVVSTVASKRADSDLLSALTRPQNPLP